MSTSDRADLHRMATQIALSYARCHNETFDAFPALFQTAYHGLLSCTQPLQQEPARPAKKAAAHRPVPSLSPSGWPKASRSLPPGRPPRQDRYNHSTRAAEAGIGHRPWLANLDGQHEQAGPSSQEWGWLKEWSRPLPVKLRINKGTTNAFPSVSWS